MALFFPNVNSLRTMPQVCGCSSLLVQNVGPGDRILGVHQDRNHNAQSIRWLTTITTSLTPPTATTTFSVTAAGSPFADHAHPQPTSVPGLSTVFGRWMPPANTTIQQDRRSCNHPHVDRTGVLHQGWRRGITPTARITLFASTKLLKIEKSVLRDNTLIRE